MARGPANVLVVPDLHCPFHHPAAFDFLADTARAYGCKSAVCIGDEIDAHALSRYPHDPDGLSAEDEFQRAVAALQPLYKQWPVLDVCESNHTLRPYKVAYANGLPSRCMRGIGDVIEAPKRWRWGYSWERDGVTFVHGDGFRGKNAALTAAEKFRCSTVMGHIHSFAGVQYTAGPHDTLFGMNVGCLVDASAYVFKYAKYYPNKPTLGCGVLLGGVPLFVPLRA